MTLLEQLSQRRPQRADAARNFDALLTAARAAFDELGADAPLEDIARRAHVGIATLYRNFPTREELIDAVYAAEVDGICAAAGEHDDPWSELVRWVELLVDRLGNAQALAPGLATSSASRAALWAAGAQLLARAIAAGEVYPKVEVDDLMRLVVGVVAMFATDQQQRDRVLGVILDGIRTPPPPLPK
ncbi:MAG: helix-turn-helix domain-containing protein [Actinomycetota bacterium]